jgi:hypothetical protein
MICTSVFRVSLYCSVRKRGNWHEDRVWCVYLRERERERVCERERERAQFCEGGSTIVSRNHATYDVPAHAMPCLAFVPTPSRNKKRGRENAAGRQCQMEIALRSWCNQRNCHFSCSSQTLQLVVNRAHVLSFLFYGTQNIAFLLSLATFGHACCIGQ